MYFLLIVVSLGVLQAQSYMMEGVMDGDVSCFNPFPESCECTHNVQGSVLNCYQETLVRDHSIKSSSSYDSESTTQSYPWYSTTSNDSMNNNGGWSFYNNNNDSYHSTSLPYDANFSTPEMTSEYNWGSFDPTESTPTADNSTDDSMMTIEPVDLMNGSIPFNESVPESAKFLSYYYGQTFSQIYQINVYNVRSLTERGLFSDLYIQSLHLRDVSELSASVFENVSSIGELTIESSSSEAVSFEIPSLLYKLTLKGVPCDKVEETLKSANATYLSDLTLSNNECTSFVSLDRFENLYIFEFSNQNLLNTSNLTFSHPMINHLVLSSISQETFNVTNTMFDMPHLITLSLQHNTIQYFEENWFQTFYSLVDLDLSGIWSLDHSSFANFPRYLNSLKLSDNGLSHLPDLSTMYYLHHLDVSYNQIEVLDMGFLNNSNVEILNASYNKIFYVNWCSEKTNSLVDLRGNRLFLLAPLDKIQRSDIQLDLSDQEQILSNGIKIGDYSLQRGIASNPYAYDAYSYNYYNYNSQLTTKINLLGNKLDISSNYPFCGTSGHSDIYGRRQSQTWELFIDDLNVIQNPCLFQQFFSHDNYTSVTFITREPVNCVTKAYLDHLGVSVVTFTGVEHIDFNYNHYMYETFAYDPNVVMPLDYNQVCGASELQAATNFFTPSPFECQAYKCNDWFSVTH